MEEPPKIAGYADVEEERKTHYNAGNVYEYFYM
jgi:hypothetical protein